MLKLEQDQKILELRHEPFALLRGPWRSLFWPRFDRKARDMQQKYELRMKEIRDEMERQRRKQIQIIEEQLRQHLLLLLRASEVLIIGFFEFRGPRTARLIRPLVLLELPQVAFSSGDEEESAGLYGDQGFRKRVSAR